MLFTLLIVDTTVIKYRNKSSRQIKSRKSARSSSDYEKNPNWIKLFGHKNVKQVISLLSKIKD